MVIDVKSEVAVLKKKFLSVVCWKVFTGRCYSCERIGASIEIKARVVAETVAEANLKAAKYQHKVITCDRSDEAWKELHWKRAFKAGYATVLGDAVTNCILQQAKVGPKPSSGKIAYVVMLMNLFISI